MADRIRSAAAAPLLAGALFALFSAGCCCGPAGHHRHGAAGHHCTSCTSIPPQPCSTCEKPDLPPVGPWMGFFAPLGGEPAAPLPKYHPVPTSPVFEQRPRYAPPERIYPVSHGFDSHVYAEPLPPAPMPVYGEPTPAAHAAAMYGNPLR